MLGSGMRGRFMAKGAWANFFGWKGSGQGVRPGQAHRHPHWAGVKGNFWPRTPRTYGVMLTGSYAAGVLCIF